ncbi:type II toxin-antitoxin system RelB/DinJ family antitoxin [Loigolactobacillus zhaoyuanensis]|uniref:Type II toxin-antitoxin system RelB/DinJ family antitoxin n=1 Tax=Loigolactobacillus zhaoyuanensis TaxID=2486017 RepID=A0ABW8UGH7_9LACO|nr:type II toxin-antitoxin system RelB/DinJ family antitoxin [Loigolactobacillus zhaoyuanensis]
MVNKETDRVTVRMDKKLKEAVQHDLEEMGLDMTTLITMTFKQVARTHELPFVPTARDPFMTALEESRAQYARGEYESGSLEDFKQTINDL